MKRDLDFNITIRPLYITSVKISPMFADTYRIPETIWAPWAILSHPGTPRLKWLSQCASKAKGLSYGSQILQIDPAISKIRVRQYKAPLEAPRGKWQANTHYEDPWDLIWLLNDKNGPVFVDIHPGQIWGTVFYLFWHNAGSKREQKYAMWNQTFTYFRKCLRYECEPISILFLENIS